MRTFAMPCRCHGAVSYGRMRTRAVGYGNSRSTEGRCAMPDAEMMPATELRVELNTEEQINRRIRRELEARLCYCAQHPEQIESRLGEVDREWDVERLLETNASVLALVGLTLGSIARKWVLLPGGGAA